MGLFDFLNTYEQTIAVDIGTSGIKMMEIDTSEKTPRLLQFGVTPLPAEAFSNNQIMRPDIVAEQIGLLMGKAGFQSRLAVCAVPGPSVFTKKILMPKSEPAAFSGNIALEAGNVIPHSLDAVRLDYHVLGEASPGQMEVLLVAVRNEIIDSFTAALVSAGLEPTIMDVDQFAAQNAFEFAMPESVNQTVALLDLGHRYAGVNICRGGKSLFLGDVSMVSGKSTDAFATELCRQVSFFWNATGAEGGVDRLVVSGGGAAAPGLMDALAEKSGLPTTVLNPFSRLEMAEGVDSAGANQLGASLAVACGLALRQLADKDLSLLEGE
jgi:type IV pilus assembly protein PilM